jgi:hypothetical protein
LTLSRGRQAVGGNDRSEEVVNIPVSLKPRIFSYYSVLSVYRPIVLSCGCIPLYYICLTITSSLLVSIREVTSSEVTCSEEVILSLDQSLDAPWHCHIAEDEAYQLSSISTVTELLLRKRCGS